jgi:hypothetical protein
MSVIGPEPDNRYWWPGPGWEPWDDLVLAGVRVVDDPRNVSPPCVLMQIESIAVTALTGPGCFSADVVVMARCIAPGDLNADSTKDIWTRMVPALLPHTDEARDTEWAGHPVAEVRIAETVTFDRRTVWPPQP